MKTLILYDSCGETSLKGKIVEGDKSKYNGICFNCYIEDTEKRAIETNYRKNIWMNLVKTLFLKRTHQN